MAKKLLPPLLAVLLAGIPSALVMGADVPPAPKLQATAVAPGNSADKPAPLVIQNANGTITIPEKACAGVANDARFEKGLCIPAQVIAPTFAGRRSVRPRGASQN